MLFYLKANHIIHILHPQHLYQTMASDDEIVVVNDSDDGGADGKGMRPSSFAFAREDDDQDGHEWEDADLPLAAPAGQGTGATGLVNLQGDLVINLREDEGPDAAKKRRAPATNLQKSIALQTHRSYALSQLAHAIAADRAASRKDVLAAARALAPPAYMPPPGADAFRPKDALAGLVTWFSGAFSLASMPVPAPAVAQGAYRSLADAKADALLAALAARKGSEEQLAGVFAAMLRALGLPTRTVHVLRALPKAPGEQETLFGALEGGLRTGAGLPPRPRLRDFAAGIVQARGYMTQMGVGGFASPNAPRPKTKASPAKKPTPTGSKLKAEPAEKAAAVGGRGRGRGRGGGRGTKKKADEGAGAAGDPPSTKGKGDLLEDLQLQMVMRRSAADAAGPGPGSGGAGPSRASPKPNRKRPVPDEIPAPRSGGDKMAKRSKGAAYALGSASDEEGADEDVEPEGEEYTPRPQPKSRGPSKPAPAVAKDAPQLATRAPMHWVEVFAFGGGKPSRAVHVDPLLQWIDLASRVEMQSARRPSQLPAYVVSVARAGTAVRDATPRYVRSLQRKDLEACRDDEWFREITTGLQLRAPDAARFVTTDEEVLHGAGAGPSSSTARPAAAPASVLQAIREAHMREDHEYFGGIAKIKSQIPSTVAEFKKSAVYVLARDMGKFYALRPGAQPQGMHGKTNEPIYLRADLSLLHTAEKWRLQGRLVRPEELERPTKLVNKRKQPGAPGDKRGGRKKAAGDPEEDEEEDLAEMMGGRPAEGEEAAEKTKLYGDWQTEPYELPTAENGIVPKNERGQVDCPPFSHALPPGTVHLKGFPTGLVGKVCRRLEVDYAPAMVGFKMEARRSVPEFDGAVVCEEFEGAIREALEEEDRAQRQKKAEAREKLMAGRWEHLLRGLWAAQHVKRNYGAGADRGAVAAGKGGKAGAAVIQAAQAPAGAGGGKKRKGGPGADAKEELENDDEVVVESENEAAGARGGGKVATAPVHVITVAEGQRLAYGGKVVDEEEI